MSNESHLSKIASYIPKTHMDKIKEISKKRSIPLSRLVSFAIDREIGMERPFEFDYSLPTEEYVDYAYADEAGRILDFMRTLRTGAGLDILLLLRHEMKIPNKETFLLAFRECLEKEMLESFIPPDRPGRPANPAGYLYYYVKGNSPKEKRQVRKKATQYETYMKLKKKFEE